MIKRSVITDEVSQDPGEVIAFAQAFHLDGLELRTICGKEVGGQAVLGRQ